MFKQMIHRLLPITRHLAAGALAACMLMTLLPGPALAAEEQTPVSLFSVSTFSTTRGESTFTIKRTGDVSGAATVSYRTVDGTAISGTHYEGVTGTIHFAAYQTVAAVTVKEYGVSVPYTAGGKVYGATAFQNEGRSYLFQVYSGNTVLCQVAGFLTKDGNTATLKDLPFSKFQGKKLTLNTRVSGTTGNLVYDGGGDEVYYGTAKSSHVNPFYTISPIDKLSLSTSTVAYLNALGVKYRLKLALKHKEQEDGYQFIWMGTKVLGTNATTVSTYKGKSPPLDDRNLGGSNSGGLYSVCFAHTPGSVGSESLTLSFPHTEGEGSTENEDKDTAKWKVEEPKYATGQDGDYLELPLSDTVFAHFGASGTSGDKWQIDDGFAHFQLVDTQAPRLVGAVQKDGYTSLIFDEMLDTGTNVHCVQATGSVAYEVKDLVGNVAKGTYTGNVTPPEPVTPAVTEQYPGLSVGGTYYFDLSTQGIPGSDSVQVPDPSLKWVPFTYAGTINAYSRTSTGVSAEGSVSPSNRSLFIADGGVRDYNTWDKLNSAGLIFGEQYTSGGVKYTMRAPSVGSSVIRIDGDKDGRGVPQSNEWDQILNKGVDIKRVEDGHENAWGQDDLAGDGNKAAWRGKTSIRHFNSIAKATGICPFRPVLELPSSLASDGLCTVNLNLNGKTFNGEGVLRLVVGKNSSITAPTAPSVSPASGNFCGWNTAEDGSGTNYPVGASILASAGTLYAQWKPVKGPATITLKKNNETWSDHGKTITLKNGDASYTDLNNIPNGTYDIFVDGEAIGKTLTMPDNYSSHSGSATVQYYTVNFYPMSTGGNDFEQVILSGRTATQPENPQWGERIFQWWRKASTEGGEQFDFETTPIKSAINLFAEWKLNHNHPICGATCSHGGSHPAVEWQEWKIDSSSFVFGRTELTTGNYTLMDNVSTSGVIAITGNVNLCLYGHTLALKDRGQIEVGSNATLTICDHSEGVGKISNNRHDTSTDEAAVTFGNKSENATINLYGGTVENTHEEGRALTVDGSGNTVNTVNLYGGKVYGKAAGIINYSATGKINLGGSPAVNIIRTTHPSAISAKAGDAVYSGGNIQIECHNSAKDEGAVVVADVTESNKEKFVLGNVDKVLVLEGSNLVIREPTYAVTTAKEIPNGSIEVSHTVATKGATVTITGTPDAGYELNTVTVTWSAGVSTISTDTTDDVNKRTFTMPNYAVTVTATFKKTANQTAVESAKAAVEAATYTVPQADAGTAEAVKTWLEEQIKSKLSGTNVTASNVTVSGFQAATAGTGSNLGGVSGSFQFTVTLTKGASSVTTASKAGTITATPKTAAPGFTQTTDTLTAADDREATFPLSNAISGNTYKVYAAAGGTEISNPAVSVTGSTLKLTFATAPTTQTTYYISATESGKAESERAAVTVKPYEAPSASLGEDQTVVVNFAYGDAGTATRTDTIAITINGGTAVSPTFTAGEFSIFSSSSDMNAIDGVAVKAIGQNTPGSTTLTVEIAKSVTAGSGYLWYGGKSVGQITISKTVAPASANADLSGLTVTGGTLSPGFSAGETTYAMDVASGVTTVTVTPTVADSKAAVKVNDDPVASGSGKEIVLNVGETIITVLVTAENGSTKSYTVTVNRAAPTYSVTIDNMTGGNVTASPASGTTGSSITLTIAPGEGYELATLTVAKTGAPNTKVEVIGDGNSRTFILPAHDVTVSATFVLTADRTAVETAKTAVEGATYTVPQADANTEAAVKAALVGQINDILSKASSSITVTADDISVTRFTAATAGTSGTPGGTAGSFDFTVTLSQGGASDTAAKRGCAVTATPYVKSNAAQLLSFSIDGQISGAVNEDGHTVSVLMPAGTSLVGLTPVIQVSDKATVDPASGVAQDFTSPVTYTITAEDGNTEQTYTVAVTVQAVSGAPSFTNATYTKNSEAENTAAFTLTAAPAQGTRFKVYDNAENGAESAGATASVSGDILTLTGVSGVTTETDYYISATEQDKAESERIKVTVKPYVASGNANLSALELSAGTLNPVFSADTTQYTASVAYSVTTVTVTPTVADSKAAVKVNDDPVASGSGAEIGLNVGNNTITVVVTAENGSSTKTYTVTVTRREEGGKTYGISLDPAGDKGFGTATVGYGAQTAHTVTVTNTGNQPTGQLSVALSGVNEDSFTLSAQSIASIAVGNSASFTVTPNMSLATGTYTATVTVSGGNSISQSFSVSFVVSDIPITTHTITYTLTNLTADGQPDSVNDGASLSATLAADEGYTLPETITVTMGGELEAGKGYTYDSSSGVVEISSVTGDVTITAEGRPDTPTGTPPTITTESLPDGTVGTAYSQTLTATGDATITWSKVSGDLPNGLSLDSDTGAISGMPTTANTYTFTVKAENATGEDTRELSITIDPAASTVTAVEVSPSTAPVQKGAAQQFHATVSGVNNPAQSVTWTVNDNASQGTHISDAGLLTVAADEIAETLTVTATSTADTSVSGTATVTVTSQPALRYTITFHVNGGNALDSNTALTDADGRLSNLPTPTRSGRYRFTGWYTAASGGTEVTEATLFTGDAEIFAQWRRIGGSSSDNNSSGSNNTETVEQPDGSTITTVKQPDGTVTETIKADDGTTAVKEIQKDGTVTETVEQPDGTRSETVITPEGTVTETVSQPDGVKTETVTTPTGDMTFTQTSPDGATVTAEIPKAGDVTAKVALPESGASNTVVSFPVIEGTVVMRVLPDGTEEPVAYSIVEDGKVYVRLDEDAQLRVETRDSLFDDMDSHWAKKPADFTGARALFQGTAPRTFTPEASMTRAMLTTVLYRLDGAPAVGEASFDDVDGGQWYANGVAWAAENGVAAGVGGGRFGTEQAVTRQELAVMLWNYAKQDGLDISVGEDTNILSCADIDQADAWAIPALQWAFGAGVLQGNEDGALNPTGTATRAEVAAMLERFVAAAVK